MTSEQHKKYHREYMRKWKKRPENREYYRLYMIVYRKSGKGCKRRKAVFEIPVKALHVVKEETVNLP